MQNYYQILGVNKNATEEEIKQAYRKLMRENHPDLYDNASEEEIKRREEKVKEINEAYGILKDKDKKFTYDQSLLNPNSNNNPRAASSGINLDNIINNWFNNVSNTTGPKVSLEERYDKFIEYLNKVDEESKEFGLSTNKIRGFIQGRRGTLTIEEINKYKRNIENQLDRLKQSKERYDKLKYQYETNKANIEKRGGYLPPIEQLLPPEKIKTLTEEEYKEIYQKIISLCNEQINIINARIKELDAKLKQLGFSIINIMRQKNLRTSNELTKEDLEETEKIIELIKEINNNLKIYKINIKDLLFKLRLTDDQITIKYLTIINNNILQAIKEGNFVKWKINHMSLEEETTPKK